MEKTLNPEPLFSRWSDLNHDCLVNILNRLTLEDRWLSTMFVCKSWLQASKNPSLHLVFDLESYFRSPNELKCLWVPYEKSSWWNSEFERKIDNMIQRVVDWSDGGVTEIRVRHCSDTAMSLVAQRCSNLEVLSIRSCPNVSDESMVKLASGCLKLKELDISYCYNISYKSLVMLGEICTNILVLKRNHMREEYRYLQRVQDIVNVPTTYLNARPNDGDLVASAIGKFMPQLLHLELQCSKLSSEGLALISEGCKNLEYLDVSGCDYVTMEQVAKSTSNLTNLKKVNNLHLPIWFSFFQSHSE